MRTHRIALLAVAVLFLGLGVVRAADSLGSLKDGTPDIKSAGPLTFGPDGILFVGDAAGAAIFAIDTGDRTAAGSGALNVDGVDDKIAGMLGTEAKQIRINDLAVNPLSGNAYLSVARGMGPSASPVIIRVDRGGKIGEVSLKNVKFARASLNNAPADAKRAEAITALGYTDGKVLVAGLSNEEFASKLRVIPFPFSDANKGTSVEVYHGAHGKLETHAPVRTLTLYTIKGETHVLAAYTCTPLVKFPINQLKAGEKVRGTTIAELGNRNKPLDMVVYTKDGKDYILIANSARGVMKVSTDGIEKAEGISSRIAGTAGLKYDTIKELTGVEHLTRFDKDNALILVKSNTGSNLKTIPLP